MRPQLTEIGLRDLLDKDCCLRPVISPLASCLPARCIQVVGSAVNFASERVAWPAATSQLFVSVRFQLASESRDILYVVAVVAVPRNVAHRCTYTDTDMY